MLGDSQKSFPLLRAFIHLRNELKFLVEGGRAVFWWKLKRIANILWKVRKKCSDLRFRDQALWCFAFNPQTPVWTSSHACGNAYATTWSCRGGWQLMAWPLFQGLFAHRKGDGSQGLKIRLSDSQSWAQSFLFLGALFFKVMMFPKAMTLKPSIWLTGDQLRGCFVFWEWGTRKDQHQS